MTIHRPGAVHRARWMCKAIYTLKIELLHKGNEAVIHLSAKEIRAIHRFNQFIVNVYLQSWFTASSTVDAPVNDVLLIQTFKIR